VLIKIICRDYFKERGRFPKDAVIWHELKDECNTPPVLAMAALVTSRMASLRSVMGRIALCYVSMEG